MGFQKGMEKLGGRKVGSLNRSTEQAKLAIARMANHGLDALKEDLEKIRKTDPVEAAKIYLKLLEWIVPKKTHLEINGEIHQRIEQVRITINNGENNRYTNNEDVSKYTEL